MQFFYLCNTEQDFAGLDLALKGEGFSYSLAFATNTEKALKALSQNYDIIFVQAAYPLSGLNTILSHCILKDTPLLFVLKDYSEEEKALEFVLRGAADYFTLKSSHRIKAIISRELRCKRKIQALEGTHTTQLLKLQLLESAIENVNAGFFITDALDEATSVLYVNRRFEKITGYTATEFIGKSIKILTQPEKEQPGLLEMQKNLSRGKGGGYYFRAYRKDGSVYNAHEYVSIIRDTKGVVRYFVALHEDVSKRITLESHLADAWERTRMVLDASQMGYIDVNRKTEYTYFSSRFAEILGWQQEDLQKAQPPWREMVCAEDAPALWRHIEQASLSKTNTIDFECRFVHKSGKLVWVRLHGRIVSHGPKGDRERYVGVVLDITERKAQQARILDLSEKLMHISEEELEKIASVLHDSIGQSLVLLKLNAIQFLEKHKLRDKQNLEAFVDPIADVLEQVRKLSHALTPIHMEHLGIDLALEDMFENAVQLSGIKIKSDIEAIHGFFPNNWNLEFYRIIQELITNILKHAEATEISVKARREKNYLEILIADNGILFTGESVKKGLGIELLHERLRHLQGTIEFLPHKEGTLRKIIIPSILSSEIREKYGKR